MTFKNVIQPERDVIINNNFKFKGIWNKLIFKNKNPIVVELGCGKGEYSVALAKENPKINYIGIDIKGARFWKGAKDAIENKLNNVVFLRTQIELIEKIFNKNEVSEIWITFPDPQIKLKREKKNGYDDVVKQITEFLKMFKSGIETEEYEEMEILTARSLKQLDKIFSNMESQPRDEIANIINKHDPDLYDMMFGF